MTTHDGGPGWSIGRAVAAAIGAALLLAACGSGSPEGADPSAGVELVVAAGLYPLAEVAERVGGERVRVENLTPPGAEPHDIELSTRQVDALLDADVVLYLGGGFQAAVEETAGRTSGEAVDVLDGLDARTGRPDGHDGSDPDEVVDAHVWLDPLRMVVIVDRVEALLVRLDPEGDEGHRERAKAYRRAVRGLHEEYSAALEDCERRLVLVSHAAFGYLTERYGLRQEPISGLSPEAEPEPGRLADLVDLAREEDATTVFTEPLASSRTAETLAREAGLSVRTLDPLEGLSAEDVDAGEDYLSVMRENLDVLAQGLGCR